MIDFHKKNHFFKSDDGSTTMNWVSKINTFERNIIKFAILSRLAILLLSNIIAHFIIQPYDTSSLIQYNINEHGSIHSDGKYLSNYDYFIRNSLYIHASWDSIYFTSIAKEGYVYEQFHAFFPFYPMLMRYLSKCKFFDIIYCYN